MTSLASCVPVSLPAENIWLKESSFSSRHALQSYGRQKFSRPLYLFEWTNPKMPKVRPRKTKKASWSMANLKKAVELIENEGFSIRKAAKTMNIPFSSLQKSFTNKTDKEPRLGRTTVFTPEVEAEFADKIKKMANVFYGCTANQIKKVAFEYAETLQLKHNFNTSSRMAGRVWFEGFVSRNDISVRKPEAISINRVTAFNKIEVQQFYKLLEELMEKHKFLPKNIYNCDETGISTVQEPGKVLAVKGQNRVGSIPSWERGKNITLMCTMSAAGGYIPPMFIYPRERMTPILEKDGPAGAIYKCSDNGWINEQLFLEWLKHFTHHAKPSAEEPVLLVLDNHASQISLAVYEHCKKNHIHMLSLPPHTSHRMQPLDVSFFGPLKAAYRRECDFFMKSRLAERITPYDVASLVRKAFSSVASMSKGEAGFKATGILPIDPNVLSDEDFVAAEVLQSEPVIIQDTPYSISAPTAAGVFDSMPTPTVTVDLERLSPIPSTSTQYYPTTPERAIASTEIQPRIQDFIQLPKKTPLLKTRQGRKKQHATILTSTPLKDILVEKESKKKAMAVKGKGKGIGKKSKSQKVGPEKMPLTPAERCRRYREKLKQTNPEKYKEIKKKNSDRTNAKRRMRLENMNEDEKEEVRQRWRDYKRKKHDRWKKCQQLRGDPRREQENNEIQETYTNNDLLIESNADDSIKLEFFDDEECAEEVKILQHEKHIGNFVEANKYLQEKPGAKEKPTTSAIKAPRSAEARNCAVNTRTVKDTRNTNCNNCQGTTSDQSMDLRSEFDVFGQSIAAQLKNMPLADALEAQMFIQSYLSKLRLQALRQ